MGKHLTIKEKLNAEVELKNNKIKLKQLRAEKRNLTKESNEFKQIKELITSLQDRNRKLRNHIHYIKYKTSRNMGKPCFISPIYKKYGKTISELTKEELREYNRLKKRESRARQRGLQPNVNKEG